MPMDEASWLQLDTQYELDEKIAENSVAWSLGLLQGSARVDEVSR